LAVSSGISLTKMMPCCLLVSRTICSNC